MIKIFTDITYLNEQNRRIVFPLLFDLFYINTESVLEKYQLVKRIEEADIVIVPLDIAYFFKNKKEQCLNDFIDKGNNLNKKVWVYSAGDIGLTLKKEVYTFRLGGFDSNLDDKTFIMPSFVSDPFERYSDDFEVVSKEKYPRIGFVGHANTSLKKRIKEFFVFLFINFKRATNKLFCDFQPFYPSSIKRYNFLKALQKESVIDTNFIFRNKYRGDFSTEFQKKQTEKEFFENIKYNPYTFCLRGAGNFSVRFYETLASGRIPFVIDTNFRLPLNQLIIWEEHCVIASEKTYIDDLLQFHEKISDSDFELLQINNRQLWVNFLKRDAYFIKIHNVFKNML